MPLWFYNTCNIIFFLSVIQELESFLVLFQAEGSLVIFIYEKLKELILLLVTRFMLMEVIQEHTLAKLVKLDFNEIAHILPSCSVDFGFAANSVLK